MSSNNKIVKKPWGEYENIYECPGRLVKIISVAPRQNLSLQSHEHRREHWYVLLGTAQVETERGKTLIVENGYIDIPKRGLHRLSNPGTQMLKVLEVQEGDILEETDIIRYKDQYGRATGGRKAMQEDLIPPVTICEIGCNHKGDMDIALEMIKVAAQFCEADVVKFQKRNNTELLSKEEYDTSHPVEHNSYGSTYGEHREFLEFTLDQHKLLKEWCEEWGVVYSTSVWDLTSAKEIASLQPMLIKIPSAVNTNMKVLDYLFSDYSGEIHISLGMSQHAEERAIIELAQKHGRAKDVVLFNCISGYPVEIGELYLLEITRLIESYGDIVKAIGFSGHHKGIAADIAAMTLGATHFERHFTLDRTWKGTDHAASLEPDGFRRLTRDLHSVTKALQKKTVEFTADEVVQREKLKKFVSLD